MRLPMSHSWKVVSMAVVFWDSLRRDAIRCRVRDIFTRRSPRQEEGVAGAAAAGEGVGGGGGEDKGGVEAGAEGGGGGAVASGSGSDPAAGTGGAAAATASVSILNSGDPTSTTSSTAPRTSVTTPASGERMSMLTLSVSRTKTTSSTATPVPGGAETSTTVPSVMLSPIEGTSTVTKGIGAGRVERNGEEREPRVQQGTGSGTERRRYWRGEGRERDGRVARRRNIQRPLRPAPEENGSTMVTILTKI
mmetsp:Transcript_21970/g.50088  ORF Transcript_21970/g.50088 Transcript_21970/m.50088 type:complete len:249 (-) Transcript_21970:70-816(-)